MKAKSKFVVPLNQLTSTCFEKPHKIPPLNKTYSKCTKKGNNWASRVFKKLLLLHREKVRCIIWRWAFLLIRDEIKGHLHLRASPRVARPELTAGITPIPSTVCRSIVGGSPSKPGFWKEEEKTVWVIKIICSELLFVTSTFSSISGSISTEPRMRWGRRDLKDHGQGHLMIKILYFRSYKTVERESEWQGWPYTVRLHVLHLQELLLGQGQVGRALQQQAGGAPQNWALRKIKTRVSWQSGRTEQAWNFFTHYCLKKFKIFNL